MHLYDVIAYHYDGAAYCPDCFEEPSEDEMEASGGVVFCENEDEFIGSTCDACGACYGPDGWSEPNCDPTQWRWAVCDGCNTQRPYSRGDTDARLSAVRHELDCVSGCRGQMHF